MQNDKIIFPIIKMDYSSNVNEFISSWKKLYDYKNYEEVYYKLLRKKYLEPEDLYELFKWKNNNMDFTKNINKSKTFNEKIKIHLDLINNYRQEGKSIEINYEGFGNIPTIWRAFLLHIIQPTVYPIFDQHVYRAYAIINKLNEKELPLSNKKKFKIYQEYMNFFSNFQAIGRTNDFVARYKDFEVDKALWAFGRAIKQYPLLFENLNASINESTRL